ncbi:APC family permease [Arthrobacter sp. I2-34]|uniref:APC family permease n=1 Tax=Arthrobacter hankyongi TaxID=2904801 RepID=A0ABS9L7Q0_9MICC|nr:APC family permease [Arthrobacter hankyongi]MCG2622603.1 APC family permease [Arthrobacter hankyongi]
MSATNTSNTETDPGASATGSARAELRGNLGVVSLVFTVIAFNGPMAILAGFIPVLVSAGNGLGTPLTFVTLGALVLVFAVGLNAMASRMSQPGAFYTYISAGIGKPPGLAAGFLAIAAYVTLGSGTYALFALMCEHLLTSTFHLAGGPPWWVWALAGWAVGTLLSLFNVDVSAKVLGIAALAEIALAVIWNFRIYLNGGPEGRTVDVMGSFFSGSLTMAMVFGLVSLTGFESLQVFRSESRDPGRTVPRATYFSVALLAGLYAVSSYAYIVGFGPSNATTAGASDPTGSMLQSIAHYVAAPAADIANVLLMTSSFAACLAIQNITARYFFTFGRDRILPTRLGVANSKHGSPMAAAALGGAIILVLFALPALFGGDATATFTNLVGVGGYCLVVLWVTTSIAVVVFFHRRRAERIGVWKATVAPVIAAAGLGTILVLSTTHFSDILGGNQTAANISLAILTIICLAGIGLGFWYRSKRPSTYRLIGSQAESVESLQ